MERRQQHQQPQLKHHQLQPQHPSQQQQHQHQQQHHQQHHPQHQHHQQHHQQQLPPAAASPRNFAAAPSFGRHRATPPPSRSPSSSSAYGPDRRHPSDSSPYYPSTARLPDLPSARPLARSMAPPPPTSPGGHPLPQSSYGPPPPRPPPVAIGPPIAFPGSRDLPVPRAGSAGMSISAMLGGPPPPASRDVAQQQQQPASSSSSQHYPPPPTASSAGPGPGFPPPVQASPRMHSASSDYPPFRRPQTPDHQRPYDPRASAAPSPRGPYSTPDLQRYGTPQTQAAPAYHPRHPSAPADAPRDPGRMSAAGQPKPYMPPTMARPEDTYPRRDDVGRLEYNPERPGPPRPYASYDDRYRAAPERDRQGPGHPEPRGPPAEVRGGRERAYSGGDAHRQAMPHDMGRRESHPGPPPYARPVTEGRPSEGRDQREVQWGRHGPEPNYRAPMDHQRQPAEPPAPGPYPPPHPPPHPPPPPPPHHGPPYPHERFPPHGPPASGGPPPPPFEQHDRSHLHVQHQPPHPLHRPNEAPAPMAYGPPPFGSPRNRGAEELSGSGHQRNLLAVQEMARKGRVSPLPQAVQGAQPQHPGPGAEPGIKSEFGRMFSGIGSGVGAIGVQGQQQQQQQPQQAIVAALTYANVAPGGHAASIKREDADAQAPVDSGGGTKAKGRRRKLKDDETRDDDGPDRPASGGRASKRPRAHHHHQYAFLPPPFSMAASEPDSHGRSHHHHHHHHAADESSTGVKGVKTTSPADKGSTAPHHHHHHHHGSRPAQQSSSRQRAQSPAAVVIPPKTKTTVSSKAVVDAVAHRPRHHLGDFIYEAGLRPVRQLPTLPTKRAFSSNPKPLPWEVIKDKENCILTVKVPRVHLSEDALEEITARAYLWGTDVYTDDSDIVAACIHGGWVRGEWAEKVDGHVWDAPVGDDEDNDKGRKAKRRGDEAPDAESEGLITSPPASGPIEVPANRDLHVNVLILPRLTRYAATTRYGMASREFGGQHGTRQSAHDGISYMIKSIRWVENGGQPQARLRGKARRERMRRVMREVTTTFGNGKGNGGHIIERRRQQQPPQQTDEGAVERADGEQRE
ncbi:hypothetical protein CDD80_6862 [Ophiocordyceps camponoti-rufipedis]|uniref:Histone deacetylation protein Rxt3 n=1 Tax=Ophiocordyceps camponoti-rufipedis TaxID=2004952 RepID=A0A2C5YKJ6_9HYPO|nr:hypothetical protein CDD80_6862 [Ophiocordyceps camponoti-rufipedis]